MACDFKPGDEVVCVDAKACWTLREGAKYVIASLGVIDGGSLFPHLTGAVGVALEATGPSDGANGLWRASRFRKVQKPKTDLSIDTFLTIKPGFEEPRRPKAPARKRESV